MPSTHKKDKPWDTDDIDKWKIEPFTPDQNLGGTFAEEYGIFPIQSFASHTLTHLPGRRSLFSCMFHHVVSLCSSLLQAILCHGSRMSFLKPRSATCLLTIWHPAPNTERCICGRAGRFSRKPWRNTE